MAELLHLGCMFYLVQKVDAVARDNSGGFCSQATFTESDRYEVVFLG